MSEVERYLQAGTRENTRRSYQAAIEHFEVSWGGFLPATSDSVARYLAEHAGTLALNTLKLRLAALSQWHVTQGFPDPTKAPLVRQVLKGIRSLHPAREKQLRRCSCNSCSWWLTIWNARQKRPFRMETERPCCAPAGIARCCCWASGGAFAAMSCAAYRWSTSRRWPALA